jgi:hypothetical protein
MKSFVLAVLSVLGTIAASSFGGAPAVLIYWWSLAFFVKLDGIHTELKQQNATLEKTL